MIVWGGKGLWVPVIVFLCSLTMEFVVELVTADDAYYQTARWPLALALLLSAAVVWVWGVRLNAEPGRRLVDPETGEEVILDGGSRHRLFWIPVRYWAPVLVAFGVAYLFGG